MERNDGPSPVTGPTQAAPPAGTGPAPRLIANEVGAALVELALSLPILLVLLVGIISYGSWLMAAHTVQQAANEAARAALAGLSGSERQALADESVHHSLGDAAFLDPQLISVAISQSGAFYSVAVSYDAGHSRLFAMSPIPLPAGVIRRIAVVKLEGV
ncbi:MAG TPA: TadE/TadG family type IV pilus assembly protein [Sphingobium sp.]|nr:TadE/TadG family type IV pilus assembly protein [Sphingobium sp.]